MISFFPRSIRTFLILAISTLPMACKKAEVSYYEIPKEDAPSSNLPAGHPNLSTEAPLAQPTMSDPAMAQMIPSVDTNTPLPLHWQTAPNWIPGKASSMRLGSYTLPQAPELDISITRFPGNVGGILSNINRWRGQIALTPLTQEEIPTLLERHQVGDLEFSIARLSNPENQQAITVALLDYQANTWFFKMQGPESLTSQEDDNFLSLISSVTPEAAQ